MAKGGNKKIKQKYDYHEHDSLFEDTLEENDTPAPKDSKSKHEDLMETEEERDEDEDESEEEYENSSNEGEDDQNSDGEIKEIRGLMRKKDQQSKSEFEELFDLGVKKVKSGAFQSMGLSRTMLKAITRKGYKVPTPIQRKCIPLVMEGKDVVGMARTGSGKTAAFVIPMIERLKQHSAKFGARAVILSPSRELAFQTLKFTTELSKQTDLRTCLLVGGDNIEDQFSLISSNPDIIIATPGRLMHLIVEMDLNLKSVEYIVFDEADRLFESGFDVQIQEIMKRLSDSRQTLMFSATLPKMLVEFAKAGLTDPTLIRLDTDTKISSELEMSFLISKKEEKTPLLLFLLTEVIEQEKMTLIFVPTRHHVDLYHMILKKAGVDSTYIYGSLDQTARKINLAKFKAGKTKIMIVTDVASRGIDVPLLDYVINVDFPPKPKLFVHRVGRAGRAGRQGKAISMVSQDEMAFFLDLQLFLGRPLVINSRENNVDLKSNLVIGTTIESKISFFHEEVERIVLEDIEIQNLVKVCENAMKLYIKSRPSASSESYARSKEIFPTIHQVHPILSQFLNDNEEKINEFLRGIKGFRPQDTIFEIGKKNTAAGAIVQKQRQNLEKFRAKKQPKNFENSFSDLSGSGSSQIEIADEVDVQGAFSNIIGKSSSFKDRENYIGYRPKDENTEKGYSIKEGNFLEQARGAVLDMTGDDAEAMRKKKNVMVWDRKKKKFVRNVGEEGKKKMIRSETGQLIPASFKSNIYQKWKEKNKIDPLDSETQKIKMVKRKDGRWVPQWKIGSQNEREETGNENETKGDKKRKRESDDERSKEKSKKRNVPRNELKNRDQILKMRKKKEKIQHKMKTNRTKNEIKRKNNQRRKK